jgi:hypothetical protein
MPFLEGAADKTRPLFKGMLKENRYLCHNDSNLVNQLDLISLGLIDNVQTL